MKVVLDVHPLDFDGAVSDTAIPLEIERLGAASRARIRLDGRVYDCDVMEVLCALKIMLGDAR